MPDLRQLPLLVQLLAVGALAMLIPAAHGVRIGEVELARTFFQVSVYSGLIVLMVAVAAARTSRRRNLHRDLLGLGLGLVVLPLMLAAPMVNLLPDVAYFDLYFEMLSSLTTTGATVFPNPADLPEPLHLWRALVAWLGGFLMWVAAAAVLHPLNLGGIEVYATRDIAGGGTGSGRILAADPATRLRHFALQFAPIYLLLTLALAFFMIVAGERIFTAIVLSMSTLSTSGIFANVAPSQANAGLAGEVLIFVFLFFAVSRTTFAGDTSVRHRAPLLRDFEFRLALVTVSSIGILLFARHWLSAAGALADGTALSAFRALWGAVFTVASFLTTTGFESAHWQNTLGWAGVDSPVLILIGLVIMGGGVATTAGGIKLLRVYALYKHGARAMQKLSFPSSIGGSGRAARRIRREGAYTAWIFFMVFLISWAVVMIGLSLSHVPFKDSLIYAISALSTTGPLADTVSGGQLRYGDLNSAAKGILGMAMIMGRMEVLALIALLNPDFWRN